MRLLLFILILNFQNLLSVNYIDYQRIFNRIDELILGNADGDALKVLDTIDANYDFIFAKHCIKALQISITKNDSIRSEKWLKRSMLRGVPMWYFRNSPSVNKAFRYSNCRILFRQYDSFYSVYLSRINLQLARRIDSLLYVDQKRTNRVNDGFILFRHTIFGIQWLNNNKKQFEELKGIIQNYGFPGEQIIGFPKEMNDSTHFIKDGKYNLPFFNESRVFIMLLHCFSHPRENINSILLPEIEKGNLPAFQYASINDFMAKFGRRNSGAEYYNQWHSAPENSDLIEIGKRRDSIGLNTLEAKDRNDAYRLNRRKNKSDIYSIYLE